MYGSSNGIDLILPSVDHRIGSKHELKQRIMEFIDDLNRDPVIHRRQYQIDATA